MKIPKIAISGAAAVALALALAPVCRAGETPTANPFLTVLSAATRAELPAKAAGLVAQAGAKEQQQTTIDVVKAAVGLNPAAAAVTVGSIALATPAMAATAAGTAAGLVPNQAAAIARAAATAAPQQAGKIVQAICRVLPADYSEVAGAVADVVPGAGREILAGVSGAIPPLQGPIDKALVADKGGVPAVRTILTEIQNGERLADLGGATGVSPLDTPPPVVPNYVAVPAAKPPYVAPPQNPVILDPGVGGVVPPGGRNYANP